MEQFDIGALKFDAAGLIPAITQDGETGEVLMLAYMSKESLARTLETGRMCYFSRERGRLWVKGETSGHFQTVTGAKYDCDADALLFFVKQEGAACHTGEKSCFYREALPQSGNAAFASAVLARLTRVVKGRKASPKAGSYTNYLLEKGVDKILKKVGEEASEVIIAVKNHAALEIINETADLMYHLTVALINEGLSWNEVFDCLEARGK